MRFIILHFNRSVFLRYYIYEFSVFFSSGGAGKITMDKLESSIAHIKDMFKERANIIQTMTSSTAPADIEKQH